MQRPTDNDSAPATITYAVWRKRALTRVTPIGRETKMFRVLDGLSDEGALALTWKNPRLFRNDASPATQAAQLSGSASAPLTGQ
ncbi:hypothetical protein [Burkholderia cenocepacia]|uniref:Uncharacterized protein n=1 Tax=Burkholderia cenocepacia TaxID=95486 RepID=A0A3Q9FAU6_9BURK|nr:hypothetical protein [Burkholderia cenocepacia]AZQ53474.1 hypothetical protein D5R55_21230 [Burkholderia cenocepacia]